MNRGKNTAPKISVVFSNGTYKTEAEIRRDERARVRNILLGIASALDKLSKSRYIPKHAAKSLAFKAEVVREIFESVNRLESFL